MRYESNPESRRLAYDAIESEFVSVEAEVKSLRRRIDQSEQFIRETGTWNTFQSWKKEQAVA